MIRIIFELEEEDSLFLDLSRAFKDLVDKLNQTSKVKTRYVFKSELVTDKLQVGGFDEHW
jgi:hypothetical protein